MLVLDCESPSIILYSMDYNEIIEKIKTYLEAEETVVAAYLYGSHASGRSSAFSDVDLAILVGSGKSARDRLILRIRIQKGLSKLIRKDVDLVLLNEIGEALLFEVFTRGKVIFERDKGAHRFFRAARLTQCLDFRFYQERMQKGMVKAMRSAKLG